MYQKSMMMYICAETPIHAGSGTEIRSSIDLPVQRERHTYFPMIQGSTLKGVLKANACNAKVTEMNCEQEIPGTCKTCKVIFGEEDKVGGISITDARLLAFPVRSLNRVFVWVTCPLVLSRYKRDLSLIGENVDWEIPAFENDTIAYSSQKTESSIIIEDLKLTTKSSKDHGKIVSNIIRAIPSGAPYSEMKEKLNKDLLIVSDSLFRDLVMLTTEITPRIRIGKNGIVEKGGLWYEEYLPSDSLLYSLILIPPTRSKSIDEISKSMEKYDGKIIHIGGNETTGKGFARLKLYSTINNTKTGGENGKNT